MSEERTLLHWAAVEGNMENLRGRLEAGDDVNKGDEEGWTPLISAAAAGHERVVDYLLENGADPGAMTRQRRDSLFYAVSKCNIPTIDLLLQKSPYKWRIDSLKTMALHRAIASPKCTISMLQLLLDHGAPFDIPDSEGNLPIHIACYENRTEIVDWLIQNTGSKLDGPKNSDGKTPRELLPPAEAPIFAKKQE